MKRDWIKNKLLENNYDKSLVNSLYDLFIEESGAIWSKESYLREVRRCFTEITTPDGKPDLSEFLIKTEASKQKALDINNTLRKVNRENYRLYNSLEEVYTNYVEILKEIKLPEIKIKEEKFLVGDRIGIIHLSDLHMNSLIQEEDSFGNTFDFNIASKRLKKYINESCKIFDLYKIKKVYLFMTGDLISSSRLLSQKLTQVTSLVKASLLTTYILQQVIIELSKKYFVYFTGVVGNESRLPDEMDSTSILNSENYDYLIYNNLALIFENKYKNVKYIKPTNNIQNIVKLDNGFNALLLHGHTFKSSSTVEKNMGQVLTNYVYKGIPIHGIFYGHYHSSSISDIISRSSSLCGSNAYSSYDLAYLSRASQNCYIVNTDFGYNAIKIDLQNVEGIEGYQIVEALERYNIEDTKANIEVISKVLA